MNGPPEGNPDMISEISALRQRILELERSEARLRETEDALRKSEEDYRNIYDNAMVGIFRSTPDGRYLRINPALAAILGFASPDEMMRSVTNIGEQLYVNPEDRKRYMDLLEKEDMVRGFEARLYRKDRSIVWISMNVRVVRGPEGSTLIYEGIVEDITERKLAGEKLEKTLGRLRYSEETLYAAINAAHESLIMVDRQGMVVLSNTMGAERLGKSPGELVGTCLYDHLPPDLVGPRKEQFNNVFETGKPVRFEDMRAGRHFEVFCYPVQDSQEKISRVVIFARDITERKQIQEEIAREREKLKTLSDNAPFGLVLMDSEGRYRYINNKFTNLFGYDLSDTPDGSSWFAKAFPDAEYRSKAVKTWSKDFSNAKPGERKPRVFTIHCKDGTKKTVNFISSLLVSGDCLTACEDITEQKKAEEALRRSEAELEMKSANLEEMNAALKVLLNEREKDRIELEEKIVTNINKLVFPYIDRLRKSRLDPQYMTYVDIIGTNLNDIISPFLQKLGLRSVHLTPTEMRIANLIKNGKTTKEIGEALQMTTGAINFHRNNIRKKLGLNNEKINLMSYLLSFS